MLEKERRREAFNREAEAAERRESRRRDRRSRRSGGGRAAAGERFVVTGRLGCGLGKVGCGRLCAQVCEESEAALGWECVWPGAGHRGGGASCWRGEGGLGDDGRGSVSLAVFSTELSGEGRRRGERARGCPGF
jgi:hypothetical protein